MLHVIEGILLTVEEEKKKQRPVRASAILRINKRGSNTFNEYRKIEQSIKSLPGVLSVTVNYVTSKAEVRYDPDKVTIEKIRQAIKDAENGNSDC